MRWPPGCDIVTFSDPVMCSRTAPTTSAATSAPASPATRVTATLAKVGPRTVMMIVMMG